ncbi:hypothetical protein EDD17DRAFT_98361 [Pisolithus thermaeus]|nr:hypothetical protein EDD17DRAFT_98361 [Pisolithus thermaeus]
MRMRRPHAAAVLFVFACVFLSRSRLSRLFRISVSLVSGRWPLSFSVHPRIILARVTAFILPTRLIQKALPMAAHRTLKSFPPWFHPGHSPLCTPHPRTQHVTADIFYLTRGSRKMKTSYVHFITAYSKLRQIRALAVLGGTEGCITPLQTNRTQYGTFHVGYIVRMHYVTRGKAKYCA